MAKNKRGKPTEAENAGRTLRRAAQVIEDRGWLQGGVGTDEAGMCVRGAITRVLTGTANMFTNPEASRAELLFGEFLAPHFTDASFTYTHWSGKDSELHSYVSIPGWNDSVGRTKEEVLQWMNKFADEMDPQRV